MNKGKDPVSEGNGEETGNPGAENKTQADKEIEMKEKEDEE
jgi:hypothetical protein